MFNFEKVSEQISANGYRRKATARKEYDEEGNLFTTYDFEHRRKLDMVSVTVDEFGGLKSIEITKVDFDSETKRYNQSVTTINNPALLKNYI